MNAAPCHMAVTRTYSLWRCMQTRNINICMCLPIYASPTFLADNFLRKRWHTRYSINTVISWVMASAHVPVPFTMLSHKEEFMVWTQLIGTQMIPTQFKVYIYTTHMYFHMKMFFCVVQVITITTSVTYLFIKIHFKKTLNEKHGICHYRVATIKEAWKIDFHYTLCIHFEFKVIPEKNLYHVFKKWLW